MLIMILDNHAFQGMTSLMNFWLVSFNIQWDKLKMTTRRLLEVFQKCT